MLSHQVRVTTSFSTFVAPLAKLCHFQRLSSKGILHLNKTPSLPLPKVISPQRPPWSGPCLRLPSWPVSCLTGTNSIRWGTGGSYIGQSDEYTFRHRLVRRFLLLSLPESNVSLVFMSLQVPQLSLMHHNDLVHLADTLLVLPTCFRPELDPLLLSNRDSQEPGDSEETIVGPSGDGGGGGKAVKGLSFLADALLLRQAAEEVLRQQVRDSIPGMDTLSSPMNRDAHVQSCMQPVYRLPCMHTSLLTMMDDSHLCASRTSLSFPPFPNVRYRTKERPFWICSRASGISRGWGPTAAPRLALGTARP